LTLTDILHKAEKKNSIASEMTREENINKWAANGNPALQVMDLDVSDRRSDSDQHSRDSKENKR